MRRGRLLVELFSLLVASAVLAQAGSTARGQEGGILLVSFPEGLGVDFVDPALSFTQPGWSLLDATCARLFTYPDKAPPAAFRLQPEVAASWKVSDDFRTYTFRLRGGFRFSDGAPVRANAFKHAIDRALQPFVDSPGRVYMQDIVGAEDVLSGRARTARGVVAHGDTLVVRFSRPAPGFVARTTLPFFCAVPPELPPSREGMGEFPSAGPFYVQEYRENERIVIRRNPYYGGQRQVVLDGFDVNLRGGSSVDVVRSIDRGQADWGYVLAPFFFAPGLDFDRSRFFVKPGLTLRMLALNSSRPLFRNNPRLRRAVNFALDRRELLTAPGGPVVNRLTDQYVPPGVPGFRDTPIYPLEERDLQTALRLARGHLRHGKAVLRTAGVAPFAVQAAQLAKQQLAEIGLEVEVDPVPLHYATAEYLGQLTAAGAGWDLALVVWAPNIPDAYAYLNLLLEAQSLGGETLTRVRSRLASAALARAARLPEGRARNLAYAEVDAMIARDVAPAAPLSVISEATLVSERVGCIVLRPVLDLAVACLEE